MFRYFLLGGLSCLAALTISGPLVAMQISLFHAISDIARIIEGPALHFYAIALGCAVCMLLLRAYILSGLCILLVVLAGFYTIFGAQTISAPQEPKDSASLRLLTVNILHENEQNGEAIAQAIRTSDADIVSVLESNPIRRYVTQLSDIYPYQLPCDVDCDVTVLSKYPLENTQRYALAQLWLAPRFARYQVTLDKGAKATILSSHFTKAWINSAALSEKFGIRKILRQISGPLIMAGDFNSASWGRVVRNVSRQHGVYFRPLSPATWHAKMGDFGVAIDHVGVRGGAYIQKLEAWDGAVGSNHRGVMADIKVPVN